MGYQAAGRVFNLWLILQAIQLSITPVQAGALPSGAKTITLIPASGDPVRIGTATFAPDGDAATFTVTLDGPGFQDEFLSMRPFRCLPAAKELWCHLEYPYENAKRISADDLVPLEYALLFLFKPAGGYGIDAWNGLYFKLALGGDGVISGPVHEVNLDVLGVPPEDRSARVVRHQDLSEVAPDTRAFARIEIR